MMDAAAVLEALGLEDSVLSWLEDLARRAPAPPAAQLPDESTARAALVRLAFPPEDVPVVLAARPDREALHWIVDRESHILTTTMGELEWSWWPPLHAATDRATQLVHVWAFLATLPATRAFHQSRQIPDEVSWATLGDLGQNMMENHLIHGDTGLDVPWWITIHFRGVIYQLGRLQFERTKRSNGDQVLGLHIPETGAMTPEVCDASIAWAHEFFPRHFPEENPVLGTCSSWLLDPQLADYLPEDSNIIKFQRRFTVRPEKITADNESICRFVFHNRTPDLDAVPQETTLQRAIVSHIKSGKTWQSASGYFEW